MKTLVKSVLIFNVALLGFACDNDGATEPTPYDGPWKIVPCPDLEGLHYLTGVHFVNANLGYCVGGPYILKWDGFSWKKDYELIPTPPNTIGTCYDIYFLDKDNGWVVGAEGTGSESEVVILHWDGNKWERVPQNLPMDYFYCVFFLDKNHGWAGGDGIARWDGTEWTYDANIAVVKGIYFNSPTDGWAVSKYSERIYHYDGSSWTKVHEDAWGIELYSIWFTSPSHGWAGGDHATSGSQSCLLEYKDGKWSYHQLAVRRSGINALHFSSPNCGWAGEQYTYYYDGNKWKYVPDPTRSFVTDIFTISEDDAWAVTEGAEILRYEP